MANRTAICGIGINDADYKVYSNSSGRRIPCPFYNRWKGMITRCYSGRAKDLKLYEGCAVDDEWLSFMAFRAWMIRQPWTDNQLDKDILRPWEKRYCPETSVFVPAWINTLLNDLQNMQRDLPVGVTLTTVSRRFTSQIRGADGRRRGLGLFDTAQDAHRAWRTAKAEAIASAVARYSAMPCCDSRVSVALMKKASDLAKFQ